MNEYNEGSEDISTSLFNKDNLTKGQKIEIDISRILARESEWEGFRHGTRAECTYLGNVKDAQGDKARVSYEFYDGEPEVVFYNEIKKLIE